MSYANIYVTTKKTCFVFEDGFGEQQFTYRTTNYAEAKQEFLEDHPEAIHVKFVCKETYAEM